MAREEGAGYFNFNGALKTYLYSTSNLRSRLNKNTVTGTARLSRFSPHKRPGLCPSCAQPGLSFQAARNPKTFDH